MSTVRLRLPEDDKRKSRSAIEKQLAEGKSCVACNKPVTQMTGPGSNRLCREHQLESVEYKNGQGKASRPYLFHRGTACVICGYSPAEDPEVIKYKDKLDEVEYSRMLRSLLEVNHKNGNHYDNDSENCETLCTKHHRIISIANKHYKKKSSKTTA
jgi:hypothetical protein